MYGINTPILAMLLLTTPLFASINVKTIPPQSEFDASHDYFIGLLNLSLNKKAIDYGERKITFSTKMQQGRAFLELKKGTNINVYWAGTSIERENEFIAIRIPLVKGLLGFRMGIIKRDSLPLFSKIKTIDELKPLTACQGMHWPDSDILESAGIMVSRNAVYEGMFEQVSLGRCTYFPRGVHEGPAEVDARKNKYPDLLFYPGLIIYYPFPMYFFVTPKQVELATHIEKGLKAAIEDGSFDRYIQTHPITKHLFPLSNWMNAPTIILQNPFLPADTPIHDSRYWLLPQHMKSQHNNSQKDQQ